MTLSATATLNRYRVEYVTSLDELFTLRDEWRALEAAAEATTIFQTWEWVTSWYEHLASAASLRVMLIRDAGGDLVGIVPASQTRARLGGIRLLHLLGRGNALTEYVNAILRLDCAEAVAGSIFESWDRAAAEWDLLVLPSLPSEGALARIIPPLAASHGYRVVARESVRVTRPLPASWELFYRSLPKSMKSNVNNYVNRLYREGHSEQLHVAEDASELEATLEVFLDLHRRRAAMGGGRRHDDRFAEPERRAFLRTVAGRLLEQGRLWPCLLRVDGGPVAAQLCLVHAGQMYTYYSGYDPDWGRNSVMMVLTRRCIERAISLGLHTLDLLLGMDQEKLRWRGEPRSVVSLTLASPRLRSRAAMALYQLARARRGARENTPDPNPC